ncbi:MFS transporter [Lysobacter korlensis]|uniref:MFS transporter n=1 Tax=Lysobacter korlensis TaxID=553636 RepID=A0ABV6RYB9_9GAMM
MSAAQHLAWRTRFRWFLAAGTATSAGDGIRLAGGPLLVASVTSDPVLVGASIFVQQMPWVVIALPAGAWIDRVDRARFLAIVTLLRSLIALTVVALLLSGGIAVPVLLGTLFLMGVVEVMADTTSGALLPELVPSEHLAQANGRLGAVFVVGNQMVGPTVGALLFAVEPIWPFVVDAIALVLAATCLTGLHRRHVRPSRPPSGPSTIRRDISIGMRWLSTNRPVRLLALLLAVMNVTFAAAFASWVLYVNVRLGLPPAAFGLLITASAVGGFTGSLIAPRLMRRFGATALLRTGLIVEAAVLAILGTTQSPAIAGLAMLVFGAHAAVWGTVATTTRQRLVPEPMQGRIGSLYGLITMGGSAIGALIGGAIAQGTSLWTPFLIGAAIDVAFTLAVWRSLGRTMKIDNRGAERT